MRKQVSEEITAGPLDDSDLFEWQAILQGPKGSPYEHGMFFLDILFPKNYPHEPFSMTFSTKIYHPEINFDTGKSDFRGALGRDWTPDSTLKSVLDTVYDMMKKPKICAAENYEEFFLDAAEITK